MPRPATAVEEDSVVFRLSSTPMAMLQDGRIRRANPAWLRVCGRTADELAGADPLESLALEASETGALRWMDPGGVERWLRLDLQDIDGGGLAQLTDVTREEARLAQLREDYRARDLLQHDAQVGTWRYDPDLQVYQFSSELDMGYGRSMSAVELATMHLVQHPDDIAKDTEIRERITREGGAADGEVRYRHANGAWVHLRVHYRSGRKLPSGLHEMYGLSQNITAAARARDEADASAGRLALALKAARAAVIEFDYATRTLWATPELAAMVDPKPLRLAADNPLLLFHADHHEEVAALHSLAASGVHADPLDVRVERSGAERWMRLYLEVECGPDGERQRAVSLLLDVDDQKRQALALAEAQRTAEQATAAKSQFLASVSHEIRTPMNGIVGVLNLLKREPITEGGRELLDEALGCSQMLGQLINDVLDFSKIEAGKLDITPVPLDPAAIAESVAGLVRAEAESKGLYLRTRLQPDIGWLSIDPVRLRQCMFNILGNAVKFTEQGGVELRLSLVGTRRKRRLRCEVEDTGIGIPQEFRGLLFDRFQQVEAGANRRFGGTGLGLAISRSLARMMGGDMAFESVEGRGSTFWFEIAAVPAEAPRAGLEGEVDDAPLDGLRVLVVDDNATNRLVGVKTLEALGAWAEAVDSGEDAVRAVQTTAFDLVLMDINMPGMDGVEATRLIRALPAPARDLPILALTANVMTHHRQAYLAAGMNGVVAKPFAPAELLGEIARAMSGDAPAESAAGGAA